LRELNHLSEIFNAYDTFIIDLWGVIHDGINLNKKAIEAVGELKKNSKKIVFLSNAPRPSSKVVDFLLKMKMDEKYLTNVMTSGEAAMQAINQNKFGKKFFHLGPPRDASIFEKVKGNKTEIDKCDLRCVKCHHIKTINTLYKKSNYNNNNKHLQTFWYKEEYSIYEIIKYFGLCVNRVLKTYLKEIIKIKFTDMKKKKYWIILIFFLIVYLQNPFLIMKNS